MPPRADGSRRLTGRRAADRAAADALRESEGRFRATFDLAPVGAAHLSLAATWLRVNRRLCEFLGADPTAVVARPFEDVCHPDDRTAGRDHLHRLLAGERDAYTLELRFVRADGNVAWGRLSASLVRDEWGAPSYAVAFIEDLATRQTTGVGGDAPGAPPRRPAADSPDGSAAPSDPARERERLLAEADAARAAVDLERRRLATVLAQLPVGVWIAEAPTGRIVEVNAAVADIWGVAPTTDRIADYSADYVGYHPATSAKAGQRVAHTEWPLARAITAGDVVRDEVFEVERPDGTRRVVSFSAAPIRDADGRIVGGTVTSLDVTERARALERVSEERAQLARLVDALPVLVTVYDPALATTPTGAIRLNRAFVDTLGWTEADAQAGDLMALCYPDAAVRAAASAHMTRPVPPPRDAADAAGAGAPLARSGPDWLEVPTRAKDGRVVPVLWTNVRLAGDRQVGVGVDLTDRKAAETALEAERTLLQAVLAQLPVGVSIAEAPSGRIRYTNPLGEQLLGARVAQVDASQYAQYGALHDDDRPYAAEEYPLVRAIGGERVDQEVMRYRRGDGRETFFAVSAAPVYDAAGRLVRAVATWSDVAERVALEDALRRARDAADAANRAKSEFLATMSHELRTPLNAISGHVQLLEMGLHGAVTDAQQDALGRVQRAQRHLLRLINDVLNFAKLEAGSVAFTVEAVAVADVIDHVRPMIEPQLAAKGLAFAVDVPDPALVVWVDREKLAQVLLNLLANAVKFTPARQADGSPGRVVVAVAGRIGTPEVAYLQVSDTGIGIPRDKQAAVFQPFVQVDAGLTRTQEGTGLGLAISRDLARGMGGDLRVRSVEGEGSVFTVTLRRVVTTEGQMTDRRRADDRRIVNERRGTDDRRRDG